MPAAPRPVGDVRSSGRSVVAVGRSSNVTAYTLISDIAGVQTWQATLQNGNFLLTDNNGFATVTPLDAERNSSGRRLREFRFAERLF